MGGSEERGAVYAKVLWHHLHKIYFYSIFYFLKKSYMSYFITTFLGEKNT